MNNTSEEPAASARARHLTSDAAAAAAWLQVMSATPQGALPFLFAIFFFFFLYFLLLSPLGDEWKNVRKVETELSWC